MADVILRPVRLLVAKAKAPLVGELTIPPSKNHAHRALMLAALADGESFVTQRTSARHVGFTVQALARSEPGSSPGDGWRVTGGAAPSPRTPTRCRSAAPAPPCISCSAWPRSATGRFASSGSATSAGARSARSCARSSDGIRLEYKGQHLPVTATRPAHRGRIRIDGTLSQWISGLLMVARDSTEPTTIEVRGEHRAAEPRADARDDAPVRPRGQRTRGLARVLHPVRPAATATDATLPADLGSAMFGLAACTPAPLQGHLRSPTTIAGHPEAPCSTT